MMDLKEIVDTIRPFSDEAYELLKGVTTTLRLKRGELLVTQGKRCDSFYILRSGVVRSFVENEDGEDTLFFAVAGDCVASMHSLYADLPSMSSIEAVVPTDLYCVKKDDLLCLINDNLEVAAWVALVGMEELFTLEKRYTYVGYGDAYSRYKNFLKVRPMEMISQIPLKYVASYLGMTPQTLSKIRKRYGKE